MVIVGIVGSPRKNGRTNTLVDAALKGAQSRGAETKKVYLTDYTIKPFTGQGSSDEANQYCPQDLSDLCEQSDALIIGAPVYWGDINGLTKDFMDTVRLRIPNINGKPSLGIAIAGGSGKGLLSGIQSIYHYFYHKQMRAIDPIPVSRFNLSQALTELEKSGARLAGQTKEKNPFPGQTPEERWPAVLAYYVTLPYFNSDPLDEFMLLDEHLIQNTKGDKTVRAQTEYDRAAQLIAKGRRDQATKYAVKAYQILYTPPT